MSSIRLPRNTKYLPKDTEELLPSVLNESDFKNFNFSYLFNLPMIFPQRGKIGIHLNEEIEKFKWSKEWVKHISDRITYFVEQLEKDGFSKGSIQLNLSWRMVIGLGASHPQETSMTLHHIYGIPYIPGSAVKGVTRHWIVKKFSEKYATTFSTDFQTAVDKILKALEKGEILELEINNTRFEDAMKIFGTQDQSGEVVFFDACPVGEINLKIDVMTPHYPGYYSKQIEPADWQSPNSIKFLTVEKTRFQFYLVSKKENEGSLKKALIWLKESLNQFGIGAKTSIGYGYFDVT